MSRTVQVEETSQRVHRKLDQALKAKGLSLDQAWSLILKGSHDIQADVPVDVADRIAGQIASLAIQSLGTMQLFGNETPALARCWQHPLGESFAGVEDEFLGSLKTEFLLAASRPKYLKVFRVFVPISPAQMSAAYGSAKAPERWAVFAAGLRMQADRTNSILSNISTPIGDQIPEKWRIVSLPLPGARTTWFVQDSGNGKKMRAGLLPVSQQIPADCVKRTLFVASLY